MRIGWLLIGTWVLLACGTSAPSSNISGTARDGATGQPLAHATVRVGKVKAETDEQGRFSLTAPSGSQRIRVESSEGCGETELTIRAGKHDGLRIHTFDWLNLPKDALQIGFDTSHEIRLRPPCDIGTITWKQVSGAPLGERLQIADRGHRVTVRIPPLHEVVELSDRTEVVGLSRKERQDYRFEVSAHANGVAIKRAYRVTAAPVSPGVFQVTTGGDIYLNGGDAEQHAWVLEDRPKESRATLAAADTRTPHFRPDKFGQYLVRHKTTGAQLNIQAGSFESVPRDCGREGCHKPEADGWIGTAHARTFRRGIEGELSAAFNETCWSCHATGVDPGVGNGGLHETAARIGYTQPVPAEGNWESAPRQIRRHGSVWCSACHGPGRILPPQFRWEYGAKFKASVCAQCHDAAGDPDAPHESPQVAQWRTAKMAQLTPPSGKSESAVWLRRECASCHTAAGFVHFVKTGTTTVPEPDAVTALTCPTCHDPHSGENPRSLRVHGAALVNGKTVEMGPGAVCASCHQDASQPAVADRPVGTSATDTTWAPHAPQSQILAGTGARGLRDGTAVHLEAAKDGSPQRSCVGCHMSESKGVEAGGHTYRAAQTPMGRIPDAACRECHESAVDDGRRVVAARLASLRAKLEARVRANPPFDACGKDTGAAGFAERDARLVLLTTDGRALGDCNGDGMLTPAEAATGMSTLPSALRDAIYNLSMVEKDGSLGVHNPSYVESALNHVAQFLNSASL